MKTFSIIVSQDQDQKTVHHLVRKVMQISSGAYSSLKFSGGITLDGKQAYAKDRVRTGQALQVTFPDGKSSYPDTEDNANDIIIAYEDEDYYVINKPAGLATMYSPSQGGKTLETGLYHYLGKPDDYVFRPINRLDKGTSGLMAVARHAHAQQLLQKALHTDCFIREYTALCKGCLPKPEGVICAPIGKMKNGVKRFVTDDGKEAVTEYRVLEKGANATLVRLQLRTGRTHQIRVHMSYMGCPVWGDYVYGEEDASFPGCFALHSSKITFLQPLKKKTIQIDSQIPAHWYDLLRK